MPAQRAYVFVATKKTSLPKRTGGILSWPWLRLDTLLRLVRRSGNDDHNKTPRSGALLPTSSTWWLSGCACNGFISYNSRFMLRCSISLDAYFCRLKTYMYGKNTKNKHDCKLTADDHRGLKSYFLNKFLVCLNMNTASKLKCSSFYLLLCGNIYHQIFRAIWLDNKQFHIPVSGCIISIIWPDTRKFVFWKMCDKCTENCCNSHKLSTPAYFWLTRPQFREQTC